MRPFAPVGAALVLALCAPGGASAWPVDLYVDLRPGEERFEKLSALQWVDVDGQGVLTAEVLPSGELFLSGKEKGRTRVLLYAEGRFAVWRVRVGTPPSEGKDALAKAKAACPGLKHAPNALISPVETDRCRLALRALLEHDDLRAGDLELVFNLETFQAQLRDIQAGLDKAGLKAVRAHYQGAGLRVEGKVTRAERARALWIVFQRSVGRVPLEDRLELTDDEAEATP
jgi:hypothetical protein